MPRTTPLIEGGFSAAEVKRTAERMGLKGVDLKKLRRGMNIEREHADITKDASKIARIALAHLKERSDYYERLAEMEGKMSGKFERTFGVYPGEGPKAATAPSATIRTSHGTFSGTSGVPASKRSPWPNQYRADRAPPNPYPGRASRHPTEIPIARMSGKLKYATPAGPVTAPSDRAGLRGKARAKMTAVNGEGLEGKMVRDEKVAVEGTRGSAMTLRHVVSLDKRVPMSEALYQCPDERLRAPKTARCAECSHFERIGQRRSGRCDALCDPENERHRATVEGDGYCILFQHCATEKSLAVHPRKMTTMRELAKGFGAPDVQARGSAPRWETPPIPDYQDIYYQPEDDEKKKKEREQQETRRRSVQRRNRGVFGFHGLAHRGVPELRYDPEDTLSSLDAQAPKRPGNRKPLLVAQKMLPRFEAGQPKLVARRK